MDEPKSLVSSVFRTVWSDFYAWEHPYCQRIINALSCPSKPTFEQPALGFDTAAVITVEPNSTSEGDSFSVWNYSSVPRLETRLPVETITCFQFHPHPPYESCTPCSRSIFLGDDPDDMPFLPLGGDGAFEHVDHMSDHETLSWQQAWQDPECMYVESLKVEFLCKRPSQGVVITTETIYRLQTVHNVPLAHIYETGVLPRPITSRFGTGLLPLSSIQQFVSPHSP